MLVFSEIPASYLTDMQRIERTSNPFAWNQESIDEGFQHYLHLGAFEDTTLVAFVLYHIVVDEAEILHLVCDKAYQGRGYATGLLKQLQHLLVARQVKSLTLEVRENNAPALKLYRQLGFVTVGRRANYYGGRHDALIQRKTL